MRSGASGLTRGAPAYASRSPCSSSSPVAALRLASCRCRPQVQSNIRRARVDGAMSYIACNASYHSPQVRLPTHGLHVTLDLHAVVLRQGNGDDERARHVEPTCVLFDVPSNVSEHAGIRP